MCQLVRFVATTPLKSYILFLLYLIHSEEAMKIHTRKLDRKIRRRQDEILNWGENKNLLKSLPTCHPRWVGKKIKLLFALFQNTFSSRIHSAAKREKKILVSCQLSGKVARARERETRPIETIHTRHDATSKIENIACVFPEKLRSFPPIALWPLSWLTRGCWALSREVICGFDSTESGSDVQ